MDSLYHSPAVMPTHSDSDSKVDAQKRFIEDILGAHLRAYANATGREEVVAQTDDDPVCIATSLVDNGTGILDESDFYHGVDATIALLAEVYASPLHPNIDRIGAALEKRRAFLVHDQRSRTKLTA